MPRGFFIIFGANVKTVTNYDQMLIKWSQLDLQTQTNGTRVLLNVGDTKYSSSAALARQKLITQFNWEIKDGGQIYTPFSTTPNVQNIVKVANKWYGIH